MKIQKLLLKLLTLLEVAMGITLMLIGISGTFSYFLFNTLICVMGFLVAADGLGRIDDPSERENNHPDNHESHHENHGDYRGDRGGEGPRRDERRFGSGVPDDDEYDENDCDEAD